MDTHAPEAGRRRRYLPPTTGPAYRDQRARAVGQMLKMTASTQKAIAIALGKSEAWVSELVNGHEHMAKLVEMVQELARFSATDAWPLALAPVVECLVIQAQDFQDDDDLEVAIRAAILVETERESIENPLQVRRSLGDPAEMDEIDAELIEALIASACAHLSLIGLLSERLRRRAH